MGSIEVTIANTFSNLNNGDQQSNHYVMDNYKYSKHLIDNFELNFNPIYI